MKHTLKHLENSEYKEFYEKEISELTDQQKEEW